MPDITVLTSLPALKSGVRVSFPWKTTEGLLFLNKTEKKVSTEKAEFKGVMTLFVEDIKGPRYIKESHVCVCLKVQGVSEVCLNTNRILGQYPVRRDGSQTQIVGNRLKKKDKTKQMST